MKKFLIIILFYFLSIPISMQSVAQVTIPEVLAKISSTDIENYIAQLQCYDTRFMLSPNRLQIAQWLKEEFIGMGYTDVEIDSFESHTNLTQFPLPVVNRFIDTVTMQYNVIAAIAGAERPEVVNLSFAHYDSFCEDADMFAVAPGADDNASGTAAVLACAKAVMQAGFIPKQTIKFIAFAAEELMLFGYSGSEYYMDQARLNNENINFVINHDMIGYSPLFPNNLNVSVHTRTAQGDRINNICKDNSFLNFLPDNDVNHSDIKPFISRNIQGIYFEESTFTPNYHTFLDLMYSLNMDYAAEIAKASCAVLLSIDDVVSEVIEFEQPENFTLMQNYPNPFNPATTIEYSILKAGKYVMNVYNILGQEVANLVNEELHAGTFTVNFDASNLPSGIYICRLNGDNGYITKKMILMK